MRDVVMGEMRAIYHELDRLLRVSPIARRAAGEARDVKVLPLRMFAARSRNSMSVKRLGFKSRTR